jgi:hypothetical protein
MVGAGSYDFLTRLDQLTPHSETTAEEQKEGKVLKNYVCHHQSSDVALVDTKFVLHYSSIMKNVTITLEEDVARWARIRAAELNTSVSRLVGEMLRDLMHEEDSYRAAMNQYLSQKSQVLRRPDEKYPRREELHDRTGLR